MLDISQNTEDLIKGKLTKEAKVGNSLARNCFTSCVVRCKSARIIKIELVNSMVGNAVQYI